MKEALRSLVRRNKGKLALSTLVMLAASCEFAMVAPTNAQALEYTPAVGIFTFIGAMIVLAFIQRYLRRSRRRPPENQGHNAAVVAQTLNEGESAAGIQITTAVGPEGQPTVVINHCHDEEIKRTAQRLGIHDPKFINRVLSRGEGLYTSSDTAEALLRERQAQIKEERRRNNPKTRTPPATKKAILKKYHDMNHRTDSL